MARLNDFSNIKQAFERNGVDVSSTEYSFTAYSLNTPLSFRFESFADFLLFINAGNQEVINSAKQKLVDAGLEHDRFFFVNFYKPKVAEL